MNVKDVYSWREFVETLEFLNDQRKIYTSKTPVTVSEFLFRGQSDSRWKLETTLERFVRAGVSLLDYYNFVSVIQAKVESVTGNRWSIPSREEYAAWCTKQDCRPLWSFSSADYFAYLRHHGFPSPLLDWTRSPYVAAYFAMIETPKVGVEKVSIYAYLEFAGVKISDVEAPYVESLRPYLKTHKRHYLQQSTYTICTKGTGRQMFYDIHENVVNANSDRQDLLWRLDIPVCERNNFLAKLELMNINSFSLFQTEDKLMEHIYISDILLGQRLK